MLGNRAAVVVALTIMSIGSVGVAPKIIWAGEKSPVLKTWTQALGGMERLEEAGFVRLEYRAQMFGLEGTLVEWSAPDGRHRFDLDLGGLFKIVQVWDGSQGWLLDQNGKLSRMGGADLEGQVTVAYLASWSHLVSGRMPGVVETMTAEAETGNPRVRFRPEGGLPVEFVLDSATGLPLRSVQPEQDRMMTTTFSEWNFFEGIRFPIRLHQSTGDPQYDITFELVDVQFSDETDAGAFSPPAETADDYRFTSGNAAAAIPIELNTVHIFMQVKVNNSQPLWFLLDTGASITVIDSTTARGLGLSLQGKIEGRGAGEGSKEVNVIPNVAFSLPGVELMGQTVAAVSLRQVEKRIGRELHGIFGYDFISRFVVEIDYANLRLSLYEPKTFDYQGEGEVIPIDFVGNTPHVQALLTPFGRETIEGTFLIDTGASFAVGLTSPYTDTHDLLATLPKKLYHEGGYGIGGTSRSYIGRVQSIAIGDAVIQKPPCTFSRDEGGAKADPKLAGIIGGKILQRYKALFDYSRERMILEAGPDTEMPIPVDMSGITLVTGGRGDWHTFTVIHIIEGSPADSCGLEVGDVIEGCDGRKASAYTLHALYEIFSSRRGDLLLSVSRKGKRLDVTIHLEPMI